jgi:hypothetical protein
MSFAVLPGGDPLKSSDVNRTVVGTQSADRTTVGSATPRVYRRPGAGSRVPGALPNAAEREAFRRGFLERKRAEQLRGNYREFVDQARNFTNQVPRRILTTDAVNWPWLPTNYAPSPSTDFGDISNISSASSVSSTDTQLNDDLDELLRVDAASRSYGRTARTPVPRNGLAGRNHEAANDAAISSTVGADRSVGFQQGDSVSLQDVVGTVRAMLNVERVAPTSATTGTQAAPTSATAGTQAGPTSATAGTQAGPTSATTGTQTDSDTSVESRVELANVLRKDPSVLKLIEKKVLQWDDLLAVDGGVSFEKLQRVRTKLQEQEELAAETYAEAQRYHQIDPVTGTRPEVIRGLNPTIAGNRRVSGTKYVMYSGPRYADQ